MGREAICRIRWQGESAEAKVLLEATELILRGGLRARIARTDISAVAVAGADLCLGIGGQTLTLELGARLAESWRTALNKRPPSLAQKLGVGPVARVFVASPLSDPTLVGALTGVRAEAVGDAALLLAEIHAPADLAKALALAQSQPQLPIWCVAGKGAASPLRDADIRAAMRSAGFIDTKSCAVSDRLTATRYGKRK